MRSALLDTAGLTVVEVIVAVGILTIGLVPLVAAMPLGTGVIGESSLKTTATFLAQQRLEQARSVRWTAAPPADDLGGAGSDGGHALTRWPDEAYGTLVISTGAGQASYPRFRRQVRISDCAIVPCGGLSPATASIASLRRVEVTVSFRPPSGVGTAVNEASVRLVTLVARRP